MQSWVCDFFFLSSATIQHPKEIPNYGQAQPPHADFPSMKVCTYSQLNTWAHCSYVGHKGASWRSVASSFSESKKQERTRAWAHMHAQRAPQNTLTSSAAAMVMAATESSQSQTVHQRKSTYPWYARCVCVRAHVFVCCKDAKKKKKTHCEDIQSFRGTKGEGDWFRVIELGVVDGPVEMNIRLYDRWFTQKGASLLISRPTPDCEHLSARDERNYNREYSSFFFLFLACSTQKKQCHTFNILLFLLSHKCSPAVRS